MRRNALLISLSLLVLVVVSGCSMFGKKKAQAEATFDPMDSYLLPDRDSPYVADTYPTYGAAEPVAQTEDAGFTLAAPSTTSGGRYHTVAKRDTLYALARMYYSDQRRWKDIYIANRESILDPNRIRVGQRLLIP